MFNNLLLFALWELNDQRHVVFRIILSDKAAYYHFYVTQFEFKAGGKS